MTTISTSRRSSSSPTRLGRLLARCSTRADGDFHATKVAPDELASRRRAFVDLPWAMADQRHGVRVVRADRADAADGQVGDIVISSRSDVVLGCWVADCAPVVLAGSGRQFAVVHAGWRGLADGVLDAAFDAFDEPVAAAWLGPAIHACCYEFGDVDLERVAAGVHAAVDDIAGRTTGGRLALDVPAAVAAGCAIRGVELAPIPGGSGCTGCTYDGFSHRVRGELERHVVAVWQPGAAS